LARIHEQIGHLRLAATDTESALLAYREAVTLYRAVGTVEDVVCCTCSLVVALTVARSVQTAKAELAAANDFYGLQRGQSPATFGRLGFAAGLVAWAAGRVADAKDALATAAAILEPVDAAGRGAVLVLLGVLELRERAYVDGAGHLEQAIELLQGSGARFLAAAAGHWLVEAWSRAMRWDEALRAAQQAIALFAAAGDHRRSLCATVRLAEVTLSAGRIPASRAATEEAWAGLQQIHEGRGTWHALCAARLAFVQALIARAGGDHAGAEVALRDVATQSAGCSEATLLHVRALHERAVCLTALGRPDEAAECYADALRQVEASWPAHDLELPDLRAVCCLPSPLWFRP
jgi:tetratricopeptide (TPR) repeat protein